jgi:hypothetical protein
MTNIKDGGIAASYFHPALNYEGDNIFEDVFDDLDRTRCTDDKAVFTDGSALVLREGYWFIESDDLEDQVIASRY